MYPYYTYWDQTYILVVIGAVISMIASANVKRSFQKNSRVYNQRGLRAEQVAEMILRSAGITDVSIRRVSGDLTDHSHWQFFHPMSSRTSSPHTEALL